MFDDLLKAIFNETVNESNSNTKNESKSDKESDYEGDNESDNDDKKRQTLLRDKTTGFKQLIKLNH